MVERASTAASLVALALTRVPDLPRWIDTRGMLLSGRADVHAPPSSAESSSGLIVVVSDSALVSIVGRPAESAITEVITTLSGDVNLLAQMEDADYVGRTLPGWRRQRAIVHVLPEARAWDASPDSEARVFTMASAPRFDHVPELLRRELLDALRGRTVSRFVPGALPRPGTLVSRIRVPMAAVWADGRPVSFCYPVWQTETLWDVSIETLESYRRRGLAARAARTLIRHLRGSGRSPVWGALETNTGSRALAARLGFLEAGGLVVFYRDVSCVRRIPAGGCSSTTNTPPRPVSGRWQSRWTSSAE
jgi:RimJ/RimL family protein N-acetyltransferase